MRVPENRHYIDLLHPRIRAEVVVFIGKIEATILPANMAIAITYSLRTIAEQNEIYAQGRTKPGPIVTNAPGGFSFHNYGLAFDFCWAYLNPTGRYTVSDKTAWAVGPLHKKTRMFFKNYGWAAGADWKKPDFPHLEKRFGYPEDCKALYQKYLKKDFLPNSTYLNL